MRVVSGKYRGKKLKEFELDSTKPTLDKVKEAIFDMIQFDVVDAVVLDLFAGTGALGIEAISRGAKKTYLVEKNVQALKIIQQNLQGVTEDFLLINEDAFNFLQKTNEMFDVVLLDPPYMTDYGVKAIDLLIANKRLSDNAIIIFETSMDNKIELNYPGFKIKQKKYGTVQVFKLVKE